MKKRALQAAIILILLSLNSVSVFCQTIPNFKPFTRNSELARANEGAVKELLDTTIRRFLLIANDTTTDVHKIIQDEFELAKRTDHLKSYIYPKKLKRSDLTIQFINWSHQNGLLSADSVWRSEALDAVIFIPLMEEVHRGETVTNLCFATSIDIYVKSSIDGKESPRVTFGIKKVDFTEILMRGDALTK